MQPFLIAAALTVSSGAEEARAAPVYSLTETAPIGASTRWYYAVVGSNGGQMDAEQGGPVTVLNTQSRQPIGEVVTSAAPAARDPDVQIPREPARPAPGTDTLQNDIVVTARPTTPGDPLEKVNAKSFAVTQAVDEAFVGPVALAYAHAVPAPIRSGLRNFLNNLHEPDVFLNFLLQLKPGKAAETFGRFGINTTIGGAGLFDVAKRHPFNLPRRANGFADSMGYYGVKPGPFLFLPLIGATTPRDILGLMLDRLVLPLSVGRPFNQLAYTVPTGVLSALDHRAEFDEQLHKLRDVTADPYTARREFYLRTRQAEIDHLRGRHRVEDSPASELTNPVIDLFSPPPPIRRATGGDTVAGAWREPRERYSASPVRLVRSDTLRPDTLIGREPAETKLSSIAQR